MFHGSQNQKSLKFQTVQGLLQVKYFLMFLKIKERFDKIFEKYKTHMTIRLASRTDAGVHAYSNACDFFLNFDKCVF